MAKRQKPLSLERPLIQPTSLPFQARTAGRVRDTAWHSTRGSYHDDFMLTVFLGGAGTYQQSGKPTLKIGPGYIGLVPSQHVGILMSDPLDPYDHYYCRFSGDFAKRMSRDILQENKGLRFRPYPEAIWRELADLIARMGFVYKRPKFDDSFKRADALLAQCLALLSNPQQGKNEELNERGIQTYLHNQIHAPSDLDAMATHFGISKSHLCREVRRIMGITIIDAAEQIKMDWAVVLLRESDLRIADIAHHVGYADPYYFSRIFRKRMHASPRQWRQKHAKPGLDKTVDV